jgi:uncharacterized membrane protein YphA (DoxX/SURF4 family)
MAQRFFKRSLVFKKALYYINNMQREQSISDWLNYNRDICIEALRIFLGIGLLLKGIELVSNKELAFEYSKALYYPFFEFLFLHIVYVIHIACGLLLAIGFITRIAALLQVPILLGAIIFVHWPEGIFSWHHDLQFEILVLVLLLVFIGYGGGRFSVDGFLRARRRRYFIPD